MNKGINKSLKLTKCLSGIKGLDEITEGGLPEGRTTLICGGPGCGKTIMAMEFLLHGSTKFNEPGVFISFEEEEYDLVKNFSGLNYNLPRLIDEKKILLDNIKIDPTEIIENGEYGLDGFFVRLEYAIDSIGAKRVVIDTIENLFSGFTNKKILRSELNRLFRWLKRKKVTAVITGERSGKKLTRGGLEEYVSDCVILLDHRMEDQMSTRRIQIVKYRGSYHGTNEYPFLIGEKGIIIFPITSIRLKNKVSSERISTGIQSLDDMLEGKGFFIGSSILLSGNAGAGKTNMASIFANSVCGKNKKCLYFTFEESESQIFRDVKSIGINLEQWKEKNLLKLIAHRPTMYGLEMNLTALHNEVSFFNPDVVILDPITSLINIGSVNQVNAMLTRFIDYLKLQGITALFTNLKHATDTFEVSEINISSLIDTWLLLRGFESNGEINRIVSILKSRGMAHSNQIREFSFTNNGIIFSDIYLGPEGGLLTGAARAVQEAKDKAKSFSRNREINRKLRELEWKKDELEQHISSLKAKYIAEEEEIKNEIRQEEYENELIESAKLEMFNIRQGKKDNTKSYGEKL